MLFFLSLILIGLGISSCHSNQTPHTFMTYNVHNCIGMDKVTDFERIGRVINEVHPEVVAIQEVDSFTERNHAFVLQEIANTAKMHATFARTIPYRGGTYGIGILSKEKPLTTQQVMLPGREEQRTLLIAEFSNYVFCSVHLSLTEEDAFSSLPLIKQALNSYKKPVFIAGDFNSKPDSRTIQTMNQMATSLTRPDEFTFSTDSLYQCIDYVYQMNGNQPIENIESGLVKNDLVRLASDHLPLYAIVKF